MNKLLKTLKRTVTLEGYTNKFGRQILREIENAYRRMLQEMVEYAVEHNASQSTLHRTFYHKFRSLYPWLPTRIIKGAYRDAVRRAKSFRELRERGKAYTDKPEVRKVTITYSDSQDWRLHDGVIELRTGNSWIRVNYASHKFLRKHLYEGWRLSSELKLKLIGKRVILYLTFKKSVEVTYEDKNVISVDINENNATLAVFRKGKLAEVDRIETGLGKLVISYSVRRKRISEGRSTRERGVRKALRGLREWERKNDVIYKMARIIEEVAVKNDAIIVVGNARKGKRRMINKTRSNKLRHRIAQWSVSKLVNVLQNKPVHVVEFSEAYTSSTNPFTDERISGNYALSMMRVALRGGGRVKVRRVCLRLVDLGGVVMDKDVVGSINIGLKYLSSNGSPVVLGSTESHAVRLRLMIPHQGLTQPMELKIPINI